MRIIAGEKRGLVLKTPKVRDFRPTLGRVRESIFGILTPVIGEANVLDMFAGSGIMGLESLSRGAAKVMFIERSRAIAKTIEMNIDKSGYGDRCRLHLGDAFRVLKKVAPGETFDLVFADPPYLLGYPARTIDLVIERELLSAGGLLVLEMHRRELPVSPEAELELVREKKYGATMVWFLRKA